MFQSGCQERGRKFTGYNEKQPEHRIAMWICCNASSFVLFDTKARATVIAFEREDDAEAFRREFVKKKGDPKGIRPPLNATPAGKAP